MTLVEQVVAAMVDYDLDESHTIGDLLHAVRTATKKVRPVFVNPGVTYVEGGEWPEDLDQMTDGNPYGH